MKRHLQSDILPHNRACNNKDYRTSDLTIDINQVNCGLCEKTIQYKQAKNKQREAEQMELKKELSEIIYSDDTCRNCKHCKNLKCFNKDVYEIHVSDDNAISCNGWEAKTSETKTESKHGKHYKEGMQTIDKFNAIASNLEGHVTTEQIVMLFNVVKYIDRMGKKDDVEKEAYKTADYFYRALNGRFLNEEN